MKKIIVLILILCCGHAFAQITFYKTFPGATGLANDMGGCVQPTQDGYVISTYASTTLTSLHKSDIIAIDTLANVKWTLRFGVELFSVQQTSDGGYITCGFGLNSVNHDQMILIKIHPNGYNIIWSKTYTGPSHSRGTFVQQTADSGYIVAGRSYYLGNYDMSLVKTNSAGGLQWAKTYGSSTAPEQAMMVKQTSDRGYIMVGETAGDIYLVKTDSMGNMLWNKTFQGPQFDEASGISLNSDNGFLITGTTGSFTIGIRDIFAIRTDSSGNILWTKNFGIPDVDNTGTSGHQTTDGGFIISGTMGVNSSNSQGVLIKLDSDGYRTWSEQYGRLMKDSLAYVRQCSDGGFIAVGTHEVIGPGFPDVSIIKTDSLGNTECNSKIIFSSGVPAWTVDTTGTSGSLGTLSDNSLTGIWALTTTADVCVFAGIGENPKTSSDVTIYPNPFRTTATLNINPELLKLNPTLSVIDLTGREIRKFEIRNSKSELQRNNLPGGIYIYKITTDVGQSTRKIISAGKFIVE